MGLNLPPMPTYQVQTLVVKPLKDLNCCQWAEHVIVMAIIIVFIDVLSNNLMIVYNNISSLSVCPVVLAN